MTKPRAQFKNIFLIIFLFFNFIPALSYSAQSLFKEPWDDRKVTKNINVTEQSTKQGFADFIKSPLKYSLTSAVKFYQYAISSAIGSRCSMYPSCSHYSELVLKKHGGLIGFVMTSDRLMHEAEELKSGPIIEKKGRYLIYDPVENNDFWWNK